MREQQRQHRKLIALQEREAAEQKRKQNQESTKGCLGCLGFIFVVWLLSWIGNNAGDPPLQQSPEPMEQPGSDDSKPGLIAPGPVLNTLRGEGFEPGMWRQSHSVDGGWCCASLGNAIEFGAPGSSLIPLPSNLSLFVYGSGSEKLDRVVIKLNINNGETADQGKRRLWKTAAALLKSLDADASEELDAAIRNAPVRFLDGDVDIENKRLWQSEIPDATASLQLEQSRLTALVITNRAADASSLWD